VEFKRECTQIPDKPGAQQTKLHGTQLNALYHRLPVAGTYPHSHWKRATQVEARQTAN